MVLGMSDPAVGLPERDVVVEAFRQRLEDNAFKGSRAILEKQ